VLQRGRPRRCPRPGRRVIVPAAAAAVVACAMAAACSPSGRPAQPTPPGPTYAELGRQALRTLEHSYYDGAGKWNTCVPRVCGTGNMDWGDDSLTYALYFHWSLSHDPGVRPIMDALNGTAFDYSPAVSSWSDVPMWDTIADVREFQATGNPEAIAKAEAAFRFVTVGKSASFARGACPAVDYQQPGGGNKLKTLETESNYVKAALLLYQVTRFPGYLRDAETGYAAVRRYFLSPGVPLYTVYVFDSGSACTQVPGRYFGSVNGNMIWAGLYLARATGRGSYFAEAAATARAVEQHLGDATGVYADLQAENDVAEPLIEAMYDMATAGHMSSARDWLLAAASAAASGRTVGGVYGRFFGGPPPRAPVTVWQVNGGLTLALAAAALHPHGRPADPGFWRHATFVRHDLRLAATPVQFTFTGRAVAIIGTIGEICCQPGHAQLFVDGTRTYDQTGIWQNKSSSGRSLPDSVLFAWRWPTPGRHTIQIRPAAPNAKEGGPFFHMTGYEVVR
jgi:hypothetical protein